MRSVLEYVCEIWGDGELWDFEQLQVQMGRKILRCPSTTTSEVVLGELGWESMKARRDEMRLRYWGKLIRMEDHRIPKIVYRQSKIRMSLEEEGKTELTATWCKYTKRLLHQLGLGDYWESENLPEQGEWEGLIRERIHLREEEDWKHEMKERSKLRTYITLKHKLERETY